MAATSAALASFRAARIAAHGLRTGFDSPEAVVERLTGVQAQDFGAARWAIGARVSGSTSADVDAAFERRAIVRSWPMRGTLHVVPRGFLRGILALGRARLLRAATRRRQQLELEAADVVKAGAIAERMLAGGRSVSREGLLSAWEAEGIATKAGRGYHVIWWLGLEAVLVHGPVRGRGQRFVLADEWIPPEPGDLTAGVRARARVPRDARPQRVFQPVLIDAGEVVGLWKRAGTAASPAVELDFFERPSAARVSRFTKPLAAHARFAGVKLGDVRVKAGA